MTDSQDELILETAESINKKVNDTFCLGSDIVGKALQAKKVWLEYIKAITRLFLTETELWYKKMDDQQKRDYLSFLMSDKKGWTEKVFSSSYGAGFFASQDKMLCLPLKLLLSNELLELSNVVTPTPISQKFSKLDITSLSSSVGLYYMGEKAIERIDRLTNIERKELIQQELSFSALYEKAQTFCKPGDRELFIQKTIKDVRNASNFGVGNCGLMADLAFLEACSIYAETTVDVTYLRLRNTKSKTGISDLNCIALGTWPEKGCVIVAPWRQDNPVFVWSGLKELKTWNRASVIFCAGPKQKKEVKAALEQANYTTWLESSERAENLLFINNSTESFITTCREQCSSLEEEVVAADVSGNAIV